MNVVVDASALAAALLSKDSDGDWVQAKLQGAEVFAPTLIYAEVASVLRKAVLGNMLSEELASLAHQDLLDLPIECFSYEPFAKRIWALKHNLSTYDAWYVALAEVLEIPLLTLDRRLMHAPGIECPILYPST